MARTLENLSIELNLEKDGLRFSERDCAEHLFLMRKNGNIQRSNDLFNELNFSEKRLAIKYMRDTFNADEVLDALEDWV